MTILHLGVQAGRAGVVLRGSFAGRDDRAATMRARVLRVVDDASGPADLLRRLEEAAAREGFVLETEPIAADELRFYLWDRDAPAG